MIEDVDIDEDVDIIGNDEAQTTPQAAPTDKQHVAVDQSEIDEAPLQTTFDTSTAQGLADLGVTMYNARDVENGVVSQMNVKTIEHKLEKIHKDIEALKLVCAELHGRSSTDANARRLYMTKKKALMELEAQEMHAMKELETIINTDTGRTRRTRRLPSPVPPHDDGDAVRTKRNRVDSGAVVNGAVVNGAVVEKDTSPNDNGGDDGARRTTRRLHRIASRNKSMDDDADDDEVDEVFDAGEEQEKSSSDDDETTAYYRLLLQDDADTTHYAHRLNEWLSELRDIDYSRVPYDFKREDVGRVHADDTSQYAHDKALNECLSAARYKRIASKALPITLAEKLFDYQSTGVEWMIKLYDQQLGGVLADEMGLGKTIQATAFMASVHLMYKLCDVPRLSGAFLVVVPATLLKQWMREIHTWYPPFRIFIYHACGEDGSVPEDRRRMLKKLCNDCNVVVITTYAALRRDEDAFVNVTWSCVVLDEGHRIRNPHTKTTIVAKKLNCKYRYILTGNPIQNNLLELWSLFDFVYPKRLGTLSVFEDEFSIPINIGGYANASPLQVETAQRCAIVLRDLIDPYLLRRNKTDVLKSLPSKTEQVIFCRLTSEQKDDYVSYLESKIMDKKHSVFAAIDHLRKVCNHPDLIRRTHATDRPVDYGAPIRSGKMQVLQYILPVWKTEGHRVLLFAQTKQMLDILETLVNDLEFSYRRLDGDTAISRRLQIIDEFNNDKNEIFIMLLTTRVGGMGVNLIGADRVILYDPDWNPCTDQQARERCWRIGQKRDVVIYRLMTAGTIEEKVYHRQIYKHYLSNRILKDPNENKAFKLSDLRDLFSFGNDKEEKPKDTIRMVKSVSRRESDVVTQDKNKLTSSNFVERVEQQAANADVSGDAPPVDGKFKDDNDARLWNVLWGSGSVSARSSHDVLEGVAIKDSGLSHIERRLISEEADRVARAARSAVVRSTSVPPVDNRRQSDSLGAVPLPRRNPDNVVRTLPAPTRLVSAPSPSNVIAESRSAPPPSNVQPITTPPITTQPSSRGLLDSLKKQHGPDTHFRGVNV